MRATDMRAQRSRALMEAAFFRENRGGGARKLRRQRAGAMKNGRDAWGDGRGSASVHRREWAGE